jgi:CopG family nickel-responsive transcriptional regulator
MGAILTGTALAEGETMSTLIRTGISLESDLLERFDRVIHKKGYQNRSEAIRDLVRDYAVAEDVEENRMVVGTLTMVYNHHRPKLSERLIEAQHHAEGKVLAATHVHLDHHNCLEVIIMRGRSSEISQIADRILSLRGVKHGKLVLTTPGKDL